jgi:PAS domain S-box-containing protein
MRSDDTPTDTSRALLPDSERHFQLLVESVRDYAIFLLDPRGIVVSWNQGAERIKGYRAEEIIGLHFSRFYPPEVAARRWPERELEAAAAEGRFEDEGLRVRKDGSRFWANVIITALRGPGGQLLGFAKITRDLTERRRNEESLRRSEECFRLLVDGVKDYSLFMVDPDGTVASWNAGAERITGYDASEIVGEPFARFYPPGEEVMAAHHLQIAHDEGRFEDEGWRIRKDGTRFWANAVTTAVFDEQRHLRGFAHVTRDLTDRRRIAALEEAGDRMHEFLAMLSHELRTPLAPIQNAVSVMRMRGLEDPSLQWTRDVIDRQVTHLTRLVDDLLEVSRITSGRILLHREPVDIAEVVTRGLEAARPFIRARGHQLDVVPLAEPLVVDGDLTRLTQVLVNLLNNAARFTPHGGRIQVLAERDGTEVVLRVRDTGMGIPAELLPQVFDLFLQGDQTLDRAAGGLGIGLTLVRRLVELHGGTVTAASEGPGRGSEFLVRLPLVQREPTPEREHPAFAPTADALVRRVLVVDDNRDSAESMALLLRLVGHEVRVAFDGPDALEAAARFRPDLVLLDIGLPGMTGYDVARRLRSSTAARGVVLVAMTGYGQEEDRGESRRAGFDMHLTKPVELEDLRKALDAAPGPADDFATDRPGA